MSDSMSPADPVGAAPADPPPASDELLDEIDLYLGETDDGMTTATLARSDLSAVTE